MKPDCYKCQYRGRVQGSAHSSCNHPIVASPEAKAIELVCTMRGRMGPGRAVLDVTGNAHGINRGWFCWPADFDPVWLESCGGFKPNLDIQQHDKTEGS